MSINQPLTVHSSGESVRGSWGPETHCSAARKLLPAASAPATNHTSDLVSLSKQHILTKVLS